MQQAQSLARARRGWHSGATALLLTLSCICALRSTSSTRLAAQPPDLCAGRCRAFGGTGRLTPLRGGDDTSGRGDAPSGGMTVLSFQVDVPEHHKAARVKVVGDHDVLGAWNSEFGFALKRLSGHPSVWRGNVQVPAAGKNVLKIEYKYVIEKENEAHTIDTVWETGIANHKVAISEEVRGQMLLVKDKGFNVEERMRVVVPVPLPDGKVSMAEFVPESAIDVDIRPQKLPPAKGLTSSLGDLELWAAALNPTNTNTSPKSSLNANKAHKEPAPRELASANIPTNSREAALGAPAPVLVETPTVAVKEVGGQDINAGNALNTGGNRKALPSATPLPNQDKPPQASAADFPAPSLDVSPSYAQHIPQLAQTHAPAAPAPAAASATPTVSEPVHPAPTNAAVPATATPRSLRPPVKRRPAAPLIIYPDTPADERERLLTEAKAQAAADEAAHRGAEAAALRAHRAAEEAARREANVRLKAAEAEAEKAALVDAKQERLKAELLAMQRKRAGVGAALEAAAMGTKEEERAREGRGASADEDTEDDDSFCSAQAAMAPRGVKLAEAGASSSVLASSSSVCVQLGRGSADSADLLQEHAAAEVVTEGQDARDGLPANVLQQMSAMMVLGRGYDSCGPAPCLARAAR